MMYRNENRALERRLLRLQECRNMGLLTGLKRQLTESRQDFPYAVELDQFNLAVEAMERHEHEHGIGSALRLEHPGVIELINFTRTTITPQMIANAQKVNKSYLA
ncbi:hypothetical protein [Rhizobium sp. 22-785-1]